MNRKISTLFLALLLSANSYGQRIVPIKYGDMEQWLTREVKESFVIGGDTRQIYEVAPHVDLEENTPYLPPFGSQWASSSAYAKVNGVQKASITVFPEDRVGGGKCARLETRIEKVTVLGVVNISVLATGTLFLGQVREPIQDTKNAQAKLITGIPFTERPKALVFDYKVNPQKTREYVPGFKRRKVVEGDNAAEAVIILQHRWEDAEGNIYAKRVATGWERLNKVANEWQNGHRVELGYGDITKNSNFKSYQGLLQGEAQIYSSNSKGENKPINEIRWGDGTEQPTHMIVRFSSGYGGAFVGAVGSVFWIDNIALEY